MTDPADLAAATQAERAEKAERENAKLRAALKMIRDGRCSCGYRFKWTGVQMRCEGCDRHHADVPAHVREIAEAALASHAAKQFRRS